MRNYLYVLLLLMPMAGAVRAETPQSKKSDSKLQVTFGIGIGAGPKFKGSNEYAVMPVPVVSMRYGTFFISPMNGIGADIQRGGLVFSPAINFRPERNIKSDGSLEDRTSGLHLAGGGRVAWNAEDFALSAQLTQGLSQKNKGWAYDLEAGYSRPLSRKWSYTAKISATYADREYNQTYFGITSEESLRTGYEAYHAGTGFSSVGTGGSLNYVVNESAMAGIFAGYFRLVGPAADSPITVRGSKNQFTLAVMMLWRLY
jgi:outer membrane protein